MVSETGETSETPLNHIPKVHLIGTAQPHNGQNKNNSKKTTFYVLSQSKTPGLTRCPWARDTGQGAQLFLIFAFNPPISQRCITTAQRLFHFQSQNTIRRWFFFFFLGTFGKGHSLPHWHWSKVTAISWHNKCLDNHVMHILLAPPPRLKHGLSESIDYLLLGFFHLQPMVLV